MKTHTFEIKEVDMKGSKYETPEWHKRVDVIKWEHDFEDAIYRITIRIK
jgi:hypothetical protein